MRLLLLSAALMLGTAPAGTAQEAVFIIRHAEKATDGQDPDITEAGRERANAWARLLSDAGLDHVITSDARRTRETGKIIADSLGLPFGSLPVADVTGLLDMLEFDHMDDRVLIVGHTETIPGILERLGATDKIELGQNDYDNLFVLVASDAEPRRVIRLHMP
ncbi:phosphoglycerate mutase family protein [Defluviimonas aestuarii]|uniref:SixA phosphatase family protein n=1 Tax=Albidovulum aestuarii TaxID=1130726 RepID=UPI00249B2D4D|nr:phosphoglycerate mutase family protein [Defluviimonas aestuarii]MDI3335192.1 phosphoglycerate mutase family protein [Defluviimonas aestuarii]